MRDLEGNKLRNEAEVVIHQGPDGEDVRGVDPRSHDLEPNLVVLLDDLVLLLGLVARRVRVRVELHVGRDRVAGDEAAKRADLGVEADLVHLGDDGVDDLVLEGPEDDGLVLDGVDDEALAGLDDAAADVVDGGDGDHEAVLAGARALDLGEELLLHGVHELRTEVPRVEEDLVV